MHAHNAYGDQGLLNHVVDTWNFVSTYVITADHVKGKKHPLKDFTLFDKCEDTTVSSMEGGVFWRPNEQDQGVNSVTTGLYLTLSAYLAEATKDNKYKDAAIRSARWIQRLNLKDNIVLDTVNAHDCKRSPESWKFTYNSGKYLEGLSVLQDVTGDASWGKLMVDIAAATMKFTGWQGDNGVIKEGASPSENNDGVAFKAVFIRGLTEVHERTKNTNSALQILIHSYVCVQYNALLELASTGNDEYSSAWLGPPQGYTSWGQLAALDTLVGAVPTTT